MIDPKTHPAYFAVTFIGPDGETFATAEIVPPPSLGVLQMRAITDQPVGVLKLGYGRMINRELAAIINCVAALFFARGGWRLIVAGEDAPPGVGASDAWEWKDDLSWPPALAGADGDRGGPRFACGYWWVCADDLAAA